MPISRSLRPGTRSSASLWRCPSAASSVASGHAAQGALAAELGATLGDPGRALLALQVAQLLAGEDRVRGDVDLDGRGLLVGLPERPEVQPQDHGGTDDGVDHEAPDPEPGDPRRDGPDGRGSRQRDEPGDDDLARGRPLDLRPTAAETGADDRARGDLGRRQGKAEVARREDGRGGRRLGREALRGADLGDTRPERADDAPPAGVGAEGDREGARHDDPELDALVRRLRARGDQGQGDDAHGLLRVVRAVRERHHRAREDLADAEPAALVREHRTAGDPVGDARREQRHQRGDHRRQEGRDDDDRQQRGVVDRVEAGADDRGADEPAEQRVRGRRRQAAQPRDHVPHDRADESREDHLGGDRHPTGSLVDEAVRDRRRDGGAEERTDQVEHRGDRDGHLGLHGTGGDRRRHRVGGVVKSVCEVEEEGQRDDQDDYECDVHRGQVSQPIGLGANPAVHPSFTGPAGSFRIGTTRMGGWTPWTPRNSSSC
ncbi:hypothetical protein Cus16_0894 [Curtobacterium sp. ER1/6]|nr:hypothetical protein Cus16_0894 [Curtobacterium sp. ER1/6]